MINTTAIKHHMDRCTRDIGRANCVTITHPQARIDKAYSSLYQRLANKIAGVALPFATRPTPRLVANPASKAARSLKDVLGAGAGPAPVARKSMKSLVFTI
ncbi:hypothetical protein D3C77_649540 [compost metagenome]